MDNANKAALLAAGGAGLVGLYALSKSAAAPTPITFGETTREQIGSVDRDNRTTPVTTDNMVITLQPTGPNQGAKIHVKPNGNPLGEWTTLAAYWNLYNPGVAEEIMEFTWSFNRFILNSFKAFGGKIRDFAFQFDAQDIMAFFYNDGNSFIWLPRFPLVLGNNNALTFYDQTNVVKGLVYMDPNGYLHVDNKRTDTGIVFGSGESQTFITPDGSIEMPGAVLLRNKEGVVQGFVYIDDNGYLNVNNMRADTGIVFNSGGSQVFITPRGDVELTGSNAGVITPDTVTGIPYKIKVANGAVVTEPL